MFLELLEKQRQLSALEMNPVSVQIHSSNCNESSASTSMSKVHSEVVTVNQFAISPIRSTVRQKQRRSKSSSSESSSDDSSNSSTDRERKHRKRNVANRRRKKSTDTRKSGSRAHIVAAPRMVELAPQSMALPFVDPLRNFHKETSREETVR